MKPPRTTLRTIAEKAGVSLNTVSLALRESPRLGAETRKRIQQMAAELGYQPNPVLAAGMAQLRSRQETSVGAVIACIHFLPWSEMIRWAGLRSILEGLKERAAELGYRLEHFHLEGSEASERHVRNRMRGMGMPGAIVVGASWPEIEGQLARIVQHHPVVKSGGAPWTIPLHFSESDHFAGARMAVRRAIEMGAKRPGLVISEAFDDTVGRRLTGAFWAEVSRLPRDQRVEPLLIPAQKTDDHPFNLEEAVRRWALECQPDAVLTNHKEQSRADWWDWLGGDQSMPLIQLGHTEETPDWPGVSFPGRENGRAAMDLLVAMIHRGEFGVPPFQKCSMVEGRWVDGLAKPKL